MRGTRGTGHAWRMCQDRCAKTCGRAALGRRRRLLSSCWLSRAAAAATRSKDPAEAAARARAEAPAALGRSAAMAEYPEEGRAARWSAAAGWEHRAAPRARSLTPAARAARLAPPRVEMA